MANIAVKCIDLEIQIHKLENRINKAIDLGAEQSLEDAKIEDALEAQREVIREIQKQYDDLHESTVKPLENEVNELTSALQQGIGERDKMLMEQDRLKEHTEEFEISVLEMEAAMEQSDSYHSDLQTVYQNVRMNVEQSRIELDNEQNVVLRLINQRRNELQAELDDLEKTDAMLTEKYSQIETIKEKVKMAARQASVDNDQLHEKLLEAQETREMFSSGGKPFLQRIASDTRISMRNDWGGGGRRGSLESWRRASDRQSRKSAKVGSRRRSLDFLPSFS